MVDGHTIPRVSTPYISLELYHADRFERGSSQFFDVVDWLEEHNPDGYCLLVPELGFATIEVEFDDLSGVAEFTLAWRGRMVEASDDAIFNVLFQFY